MTTYYPRSDSNMPSYTILYTYRGFYIISTASISTMASCFFSSFRLYRKCDRVCCKDSTIDTFFSLDFLFLLEVTNICNRSGHTQNHQCHASSGYFGRLTVIRHLSPCMPMKCPRANRNQQLPLLMLHCPLGRIIAVMEDNLNGWLVVYVASGCWIFLPLLRLVADTLLEPTAIDCYLMSVYIPRRVSSPPLAFPNSSIILYLSATNHPIRHRRHYGVSLRRWLLPGTPIPTALTTGKLTLGWTGIHSIGGLIYASLYGVFFRGFVSLAYLSLTSLAPSFKRLRTRMGMCSVICRPRSLYHSISALYHNEVLQG